MFRVIILAVFGCLGSLAAQDREAVFAQANAEFENGDFAAAESSYRKLVEDGEISEDLFFNLGNAIYRQNRPGEAALWFQRSRVLDPRMPEANQNLRFLQKTTGFLNIEREPLDAFLFQRKPSELVFLASLGAWVFLLSLTAIFVIRKLRDWRPLMIIIAIFGFALGAAALWAGRQRAENLAIEHFAIVVGEDVSALTAPAPGSEAVISLPQGSEVRIIQDRGPWKYVHIPGDLRGWVNAEDAIAIWPVQ